MFVIDVPYFNLDQIYSSGQVPRWIKVKESKYVIPFKDKALKIEQQRNKFDWNRYRLVMNCSEEDFYNTWFEYLDLKTDCMNANMRIKHLGGKFKTLAVSCSGIHIMHQDTFEAYVLAKLITYVGYEKAKVAMNHIADVCGIKHIQSMREIGKVIWYEWPTANMILEHHGNLAKMGKINSWLLKLCKAIVNDGYEYDKSDNELFALFGMNELSVFPTARIEDVLKKNFEENPEDFSDLYLDSIDEKGLVYMYIVHRMLKKQSEVVMWG